METTGESWYIVKRPSNHCEIVLGEIVSAQDLASDDNQANAPAEGDPNLDQWGPFKAKNQAIAKRIGLIRAGKCQPL